MKLIYSNAVIFYENISAVLIVCLVLPCTYRYHTIVIKLFRLTLLDNISGALNVFLPCTENSIIKEITKA